MISNCSKICASPASKPQKRPVSCFQHAFRLLFQGFKMTPKIDLDLKVT